MDLLFYESVAKTGISCISISKVYGEYKTPSKQPLGVMKVSQLDPRNPVVIDQCEGQNSVKQVSRECRFFIPNNPTESSVVKANIENLVNKKIYVLKPVPIKTKEEIKQEMLKTFFQEDGKTLINEKFGSLDYPLIRPHNMVEAGFKFVGNKRYDAVKCYHTYHTVHSWEPNDNPAVSHQNHFNSKTCFTDDNIERGNYPALYEGNKNVTGKKYEILMEELHIDRSCKGIKVVTHKDNPINLITFKALLGQVDSAKLDRCKQTMEQMKQSGNDFNDQYSDLLKQALFLEHFSCLVRQFEDAKSAYITALEQYKTTHANRDYPDIDGVLASLNTNTVREEIDRVISTISEYQMISSATHPISNLKFLSKENHDLTYNAMKQTAEKSFNEIADLYNKHFFVDKTLNTFMCEGKFATVGSIKYFNDKYSRESQREVITKGTALTATLFEIAEKITTLCKTHQSHKRLLNDNSEASLWKVAKTS